MKSNGSALTEEKFRSKIVRRLAAIHAFPVENSAYVGAPDVATVLGWIELKIAKKGRDVNGIVAINLRNTQRTWLRRWGRLGGRAWVMTKMSELVLLHSGTWAAEHLGRRNEPDLIYHAISAWCGIPDGTDLINSLLRPL